MTGEGGKRKPEMPTNKVDRVLREYDLTDLGDELERAWLGKGEEQASTRELADLFNRRVLRAAIEENESFEVIDDTEYLYRTLIGDSQGDSTLLRSRLKQRGVEVEAVMNDFISHQTVYRYLRNHRNVERKTPSPDQRVEDAIETVQRLQGRTTAVTKQTVESFRDSGSISLGQFSVFTEVQILCEDCGQSYDAAELLEEGCDCGSD